MGRRITDLKAKIAVFEDLIGKVGAEAVDTGVHVGGGRHRRDVRETLGAEFVKPGSADPLGDPAIRREPGADAPDKLAVAQKDFASQRVGAQRNDLAGAAAADIEARARIDLQRRRIDRAELKLLRIVNERVGLNRGAAEIVSVRHIPAQKGVPAGLMENDGTQRQRDAARDDVGAGWLGADIALVTQARKHVDGEFGR